MEIDMENRTEERPDEHTTNEEEPLSTREVLGWLELSCWTMVALAPFLYWVNGPAVSTDQAVVRGIVFGVALTGGIAIRAFRLCSREK